MTARRPNPAREALLVWLGLCAVVAALSRVGEGSRTLATLAAVAIPNAILWAAPAAIYFTRRNFAEYGVTLANWRRGARLGLAASSVALPLFAVGYWLLWRTVGAAPPVWRLDAALAPQAATQLLAVAVPEETFFRGYLQTLFEKAWPTARGQAAAVTAAAACFALLHTAAVPQPARLLVFFPGLLFGWLRRRAGSLAAPIVFHALANLTVLILEGGG